MSPQLIAGLVILFLTGLFGTLGYLVRGMGGIREDVREIKTTLGINGHPKQGLVPEVEKLRDAKHDHANKITTLMGQMAEVRERLP